MTPRLLALTAVVLAAGCGGGSGGPRLAHDDAQSLIALTHRIAGEGACAQAKDIPRLRTKAIALVNARKVPAALQDTLLSGVNALAAQTPVCLPAVTVSQQPPPVPPPAPAAKPKPRGHGHGPGPGHGHGHGHGKKH